MRSTADNAHRHLLGRAAALGLCLLASGCAGEHLFRAQDRKIEELRLERARQDEALGRTREALDQLREEWKSYAARESSASKETAALQGAMRKLAQRMDELDGKRAKLEERLHLAETKSTELNQAFTQVSSVLKAAEGDLIAWRSSRLAAGSPLSSAPGGNSALAASGRDGSGKTPGETNNAAESARTAGTIGSWIDGMLPSRGSFGLFYGAALLASGVLVALVCVNIGAKLRPAAPARPAEREKKREKAAAKRQAAPAPEEAAQPAEESAEDEQPDPAPQPAPPPAARVPAAPARLVFPTEVVDDFFDAAENAGTRFAKGASKRPAAAAQPQTEQPPQNTQVIGEGPAEEPASTDKIAGDEETSVTQEISSPDELSNTDVLPVAEQVRSVQPETIVAAAGRGARKARKPHETQAQTQVLDGADPPERTQVIGEEDEGLVTATHAPRRTPSTRELLGGKSAQRNAAVPPKKKTKAPDEKDLLDELENIIGYKMGEKSV